MKKEELLSIFWLRDFFLITTGFEKLRAFSIYSKSKHSDNLCIVLSNDQLTQKRIALVKSSEIKQSSQKIGTEL